MVWGFFHHQRAAESNARVPSKEKKEPGRPRPHPPDPSNPPPEISSTSIYSATTSSSSTPTTTTTATATSSTTPTTCTSHRAATVLLLLPPPPFSFFSLLPLVAFLGCFFYRVIELIASLRRQLWVRHHQDPGLSNRRWTEKSLPPSLLHPPTPWHFSPLPRSRSMQIFTRYPLLSVLPHMKWYKVTASSSGVFMFLMTVQCFSFVWFFWFFWLGKKIHRSPSEWCFSSSCCLHPIT